MQVFQTAAFQKTVKKLHANQKRDLDQAVRHLTQNPTDGEPKIGDLSGVYVYKFKMINQLTLLAYSYQEEAMILTLLALGSHENFYRDMKRGF